ncbi:hypothetical protein O2W18_21340 [Modestobacter sp. VKM Ac-2983]|uniref:hypothetical protein n=1 Tax=Modestobacter sp. VKM Ac-2983 TaxID=3004137 RepID=UPI0022AB5370|nr:hypothetical protein [Modestobacter sp. VKM Ac-2983]MCZ2807659.1 hypothetical protein [Modestobacter sp. VKM Ac-2983]
MRPPPPLTVAFCPQSPLVLPAVAGAPTPALSVLRTAVSAAVQTVLADRPEVVVVVGEGADGLRFGPGDAGDLRGFGVDLEVPFAGRVRAGGHRVPLPHLVAAWLLDEAGHTGGRLGVGPADLAAALADLPGPVGVLAMGDGSARRTEKAPGALDPAAGPFDAAVAAALGAGDCTALAGLDPDAGRRLLAAGVPVWRAVGAALEGRAVTAELHHDDAPFGVGYLVAAWRAR